MQPEHLYIKVEMLVSLILIKHIAYAVQLIAAVSDT